MLKLLRYLNGLVNFVQETTFLSQMQLATIVPTRDRLCSYNVLACCATREPRHRAQDAGAPVYEHAVGVEFNLFATAIVFL